MDGKLLRRNRVHLREDQQVEVTEPSSNSAEQKPTAEDLPVAVVEKNKKKVKPLKDTAKAAELAKCTKMDLTYTFGTLNENAAKIL